MGLRLACLSDSSVSVVIGWVDISIDGGGFQLSDDK